MSWGPMFGFEGSQIDLSDTGCVIAIQWRKYGVVSITDAGWFRRYLKGFVLEGTMNWSGNAGIPEALMAGLMAIFNEPADGRLILLTPYPLLYPDVTYDVVWADDLFNFQPVRGLEKKIHVGSIAFRSRRPYDTALYLSEGSPPTGFAPGG